MKKRQIVLVAILIMAISLSGGFLAYKYLFQPKAFSEVHYDSTFCSDTDGKNPAVKGSTSYGINDPEEGGTYETPDTCEFSPENGEFLRERWCNGNSYYETLFKCGKFRECIDGACVKK